MSRCPPPDTPLPVQAAHPAAFVTTNWSAVWAAKGPDTTAMRDALAGLCEKYWYPLYAYVRRQGHSPEDAQDLTQEFFARLLEHHWLMRADKAKGRFRSFLLMVIKRFLANEWDKAKTQKRGGLIRFESFSYETAEAAYATNATIRAPAAGTPELQFEREWALALLGQVLRQLGDEYAKEGKGDLFGKAKPCLLGIREGESYAVLCAELGMTEAAFKMAVSRMRRRFRERLKTEVAKTVASPADVDDELRHLFRVLARS